MVEQSGEADKQIPLTLEQQVRILARGLDAVHKRLGFVEDELCSTTLYPIGWEPNPLDAWQHNLNSTQRRAAHMALVQSLLPVISAVEEIANLPPYEPQPPY